MTPSSHQGIHGITWFLGTSTIMSGCKTGPSILNNIGLQANYLHPDVTDRWAFCSHHLWSPCDRDVYTYIFSDGL
uniref:Uncharacterized protein n=2 Tax=Canis lupus familiaris TaxID=9615 RepID=A0A8C0NHQ2_CANLF